MEKYVIPGISHFNIISFLLFGILLFLALKLLRLLMPKLLRKPLRHSALQPYYSTFEFIIWLIFLIGSAAFFYKSHKIYAGAIALLIIVVLLWFGWYVLRELVAGFFIRNNPAIEPGQKIAVGGQVLIIDSLKGTGIEGTLANGNRIYLPYSKISGRAFEKIIEEEQFFSRSIKLRLRSKANPDKLLEDISKALLNHPYYAIKKAPQIKYSDGGNHEIEVTFHALEGARMNEIEQYLRQKFE